MYHSLVFSRVPFFLFFSKDPGSGPETRPDKLPFSSHMSIGLHPRGRLRPTVQESLWQDKVMCRRFFPAGRPMNPAHFSVLGVTQDTDNTLVYLPAYSETGGIGQ